MFFALTTLGCKVNQYDGQAVAAALVREGLRPAGAEARPDLLVVNTCCVTATAMRKSRQAIRRAVRSSPAAAVLVVGCYSDYDGGRIRGLLGGLGIAPRKVFLAGHHDDLGAAVRLVARSLQAEPEAQTPPASCSAAPRTARSGDDLRIAASRVPPAASSPASIRARRQAAVKRDLPGAAGLGPIERFAAHQRAFVKVQDGCDAFCTYCIVPYTRPRVWSRSVDEIADECARLVAAGHREIVLCGVFLGAFGRGTAVRRRWGDSPGALAALVRRVAGIEGLWRLRLSSLEPGDVTDELLEACADLPNVAPHLHLPLQSGSPRILRRMNRQYTVEHYARTVEAVRAALDRPALTTDIIVGFPGETDEDFAATLAVARHAAFAKIHAFPFSAVEGTTAWAWRGEGPPAGVVKDRLAALCKLEREMAEAFRRRFVGETMEGLVERGGGRGRVARAMTDRYLAVEFGPPPGSGALTGQVVRLRIDAVAEGGLTATVV